MIPLLQSDYYKYSQMFRGNFLKGATLFRSLLNNPETAEPLINSGPAMASVFTDFSISQANRQCFNVLAEKPFYEEAMMTYLKDMAATAHETSAELLTDTGNMIGIFRNPQFDPVFQEKPDLIKKALLKRNIYGALGEDANSDVALAIDKLRSYSSLLTGVSANIHTSFSTYWSTLNGTDTPFSATEKYYSYTMQYDWSVVCEETAEVFMPATLRTRVGTSSTYYYYPCVFKYGIVSQTWTLLAVCSTESKQTSTDYYGRQAYGIAFDPGRDMLYIFYKATSSSTFVTCDIVKGSTGEPLQIGIQTSSVGSSSQHMPFFCCFDRESGLAKYVWRIDNMYTTGANGWLYGCSVGQTGLVWEGKAAHPYSEWARAYSGYSNEMVGGKFRFTKGAIVGVYQKGESTSTYPAVMVSIHSSGNKFTASYIEFTAKTPYSTLYSPNHAVVMENGMAVLSWSSIDWGDDGGSSRAVAVILEITEGALKRHASLFRTTSYAYTPYSFLPFNKIAVIDNQYPAICSVFGLDGSGGMIRRDCNETFAAFYSQLAPARGSRRYKLHTPGSSNWTLYDFETEVTA